MGPMLTRNLYFGFNLVSLAGLLVMGVGLHLARTAQVRAPVGIGLMGIGTALVFFGLYVGVEPS
jgi:hypothetical protein